VGGPAPANSLLSSFLDVTIRQVPAVSWSTIPPTPTSDGFLDRLTERMQPLKSALTSLDCQLATVLGWNPSWAVVLMSRWPTSPFPSSSTIARTELAFSFSEPRTADGELAAPRRESESNSDM
jgi:hypothetical protein